MLHKIRNIPDRIALLADFQMHYNRYFGPRDSSAKANQKDDYQFIQRNLVAVESIVADVAGRQQIQWPGGRMVDPFLECLSSDREGFGEIFRTMNNMIERAIGVYEHMSRDTGMIMSGPLDLDLVAAVERGLRPAFDHQPERERDVQNVMNAILTSLGVKFSREQDQVAAGTRGYKPDFIIDDTLALEVKLIKPNKDLSTVEEEMAADITGYRERWSVWFVLYDCGVIRDPARMKNAYQQSWGVTVSIVKH